MTLDRPQAEAVQTWLVQGQSDRYEAWLATLPPETRADDPWLRYLEGFAYLLAFRHSEAAWCLARAHEGFEAAGQPVGQFAAGAARMLVACLAGDWEQVGVWHERTAGHHEAGALPDRAYFYNTLGCAAYAAAREDEALSYWHQTLSLPCFGSVLVGYYQQVAAVNLGLWAIQRARYEEAERRFRHALALEERFPTGRPCGELPATVRLAQLTYFRGDFAGAEARLATLGEVPNNQLGAIVATLRGRIRLAKDQLKAAGEQFAQAIGIYDALSIAPVDLARAFGLLAEVCARQGRQAEAERLFERAMSADASSARLRTELMLRGVEAGLRLPEQLQEAWTLAGEADLPDLQAWAGLRLGGDKHAEAVSLIERYGCWWLASVPSLRPHLAKLTRPQAQEEPPLSIRALGCLDVRVDGQAVDNWPRKKVALLLMALALRPEGYAREALLDLLFPEAEGADVLPQLNNLTHALRKCLEPQLDRKGASAFLEVADGCYRLRPGTFRADFLDFDQALSRARACLRAGDRARWEEWILQALERYDGDLLAEPNYQEWFDLERHGYRQRFLRAGLELAEARANGGRTAEAEAIWDRLLEVDPTCEEAHGALIALYTAQGRGSLARLQRKRLAAAMQQLGLDPAVPER